MHPQQRHHGHTISAHCSIKILTYQYSSWSDIPMRPSKQRKMFEHRLKMMVPNDQSHRPWLMTAERSHPFAWKYYTKWLRCCGRTKIRGRTQEQIRQPPGRVLHQVVMTLQMLPLWLETQQMLSWQLVNIPWWWVGSQWWFPVILFVDIHSIKVINRWHKFFAQYNALRAIELADTLVGAQTELQHRHCALKSGMYAFVIVDNWLYIMQGMSYSTCSHSTINTL